MYKDFTIFKSRCLPIKNQTQTVFHKEIKHKDLIYYFTLIYLVIFLTFLNYSHKFYFKTNLNIKCDFKVSHICATVFDSLFKKE